MSTDPIEKIKARATGMRKARDEILRRVSFRLVEIGFTKERGGYFRRRFGDRMCDLWFDKKSSGHSVGVLSRTTALDGTGYILGPYCGAHGWPEPANGKRYQFEWSTRETDIARSANEYWAFVKEVLLPWFNQQLLSDQT